MPFNRSAFILAAVAFVTAPAFADVSVGVGINLPGVAVPVPAPVYAPAPVYVAPPRPVYVAPPPAVYYAPAPGYYEPEYRRRHRHEDWDDNDQGRRGGFCPPGQAKKGNC